MKSSQLTLLLAELLSKRPVSVLLLLLFTNIVRVSCDILKKAIYKPVSEGLTLAFPVLSLRIADT